MKEKDSELHHKGKIFSDGKLQYFNKEQLRVDLNKGQYL